MFSFFSPKSESRTYQSWTSYTDSFNRSANETRVLDNVGNVGLNLSLGTGSPADSAAQTALAALVILGGLYLLAR